MIEELQPENLLTAYCCGIFPMADHHGVIRWMRPDPRAVLELDGLQVSRSLRATLKKALLDLRINSAFDQVIAACADRPEGTWISDQLRAAYEQLHRLGFAHSVESWEGDRLVGGLYGVSIGGAFFGESMFHRVSDASKVALVGLVERMKSRGMALLDVQFMTEHLHRLGAQEIRRREYERRLRHAIQMPCRFAEGPNGS